MKIKLFSHENGYSLLTGLAAGTANGLFGSGGGMLAVPLLEQSGSQTKNAHATSLAITLPLSVISAAEYVRAGNLDIYQAIKFLPGGIVGAAAGAMLMKKTKPEYLDTLFGAVMIYSGMRMLIN